MCEAIRKRPLTTHGPTTCRTRVAGLGAAWVACPIPRADRLGPVACFRVRDRDSASSEAPCRRTGTSYCIPACQARLWKRVRVEVLTRLPMGLLTFSFNVTLDG